MVLNHCNVSERKGTGKNKNNEGDFFLLFLLLLGLGNISIYTGASFQLMLRYGKFKMHSA